MVQKWQLAVVLVVFCLASAFLHPAASAQAIDTSPPDTTVKLVFIHHSTGENWLADDNGGLARELQENHYFISDTNYGWGPDAIGDRTDIPNWWEWFRGPESSRYLEALFAESEVHSPYERMLADPGGENTIVLFKSCFPNSALEGSPDDAAAPGYDLTVSNAKYVYNEILQYFLTRPDKLFIVITAPPLIDGSLAKNARAFNNWLVHDWLAENNYPYRNVAVFDFYNVLTAPENHHRVWNGTIEHVIDSGRNTEYYPSEDDHPARKGNLKATEEFIPLLNAYYHVWKDSAESGQPAPQDEPTQAVNPPLGDVSSVGAPMRIDDFEGEVAGWEAFKDESPESQMLCYPSAEYANSGDQSIQMDFDIPPASWGTCYRAFDTVQDWSAAQGIQFQVRSTQSSTVMHVDLYSGPEGAVETYLVEVKMPEGAEQAWQTVNLRWDDFQRADWEENAGAIFEKQREVTGFAFGFPEIESGTNQGTVWVDDLVLLVDAAVSTPPTEAAEEGGESQMATPQVEEEPQEGSTPTIPFCGGIIALPIVWVLLTKLFLARR